MILINGQLISNVLRKKLANQIKKYKYNKSIIPKLVTIVIGNNYGNNIYMSIKEKACFQVGINSEIIKLSKYITESKLLAIIDQLNNDSNVHAILLQLPLSNNINQYNIMYKIKPEKDVDGLNPLNIGKIALKDKKSLKSCTANGIITMLKMYNIKIKGSYVVVVGASNIVGKPIFNLLLNNKATITICHSFTNNLKFYTVKADILIVAVGRPNFITVDMVKYGSIVIDAGINYINGKIVGDVNFSQVKDKVYAITPVPGGVGPMTVTQLLYNTFQCCKIQNLKK